MAEIEVTMGPGLKVTVDFDKPVSQCRGCGMNIYWAKTSSGRSMPVVVHSHFLDCKKASEFRKGKVKDGL